MDCISCIFILKSPITLFLSSLSGIKQQSKISTTRSALNDDYIREKKILVDYFPKRVDKNKDVNVVIFSTQNFFSLEMMLQKKNFFLTDG